jgi:CheY-like chemotaxis protein
MTGVTSLEAVERQLESEFLGEMQDTLNALDVLLENLRSHGAEPDEAVREFRRAFLSLEARAATVDMALVRMICHRGSEYVADLERIGDRHFEDLQAFVDQLRRSAEGDQGPIAEVGPQIARALPSRTAADFDISDIRQMNVEALVAIPEKAMGRLIERELVACGYRVTNARTSFRLLEMAVRTRPDFVIVAGVLDELSGIDVASALVAMPATHRIPTAVLTSYGWGHASLDHLPVRVAILRKGPEFGSDLAEFLARFRIT